MGFILFLLIVLLIYLVAILVIKLIEEKHVKTARETLPGKVVVITGATSALGQSLAHRFYNAGCKVVLVSRREHELARIRSQLVSSRPNNVPIYQPETVVLDLDDVQSLPAKAAEILDKCGQVDVLLNNGSTTARSDVLSSDVDVDIRVMNVNYFGTVALTKALLPSMVQRKQGKIVCVSSVAGLIPIPFRSSYAASQHALQAFCDSLRAEIAIHNIQVLVCNPGYKATDAVTPSPITEVPQTTSNDENPKKTTYKKTASEEIFDAILRDDKENTPLAFTWARWVRVTCPPFYHLLMARRAQKTAPQLEINQRY